MCGLEVALGAGAKAVGEAVLAEGMKEAGKAALKQLLTKFDKEKDPVVFFSLFCSFKELPSYDIASSQLNTILESTSLKGQYFAIDKHTFKYWLSWDEFEGCEVPEDSWELDTYAVDEEDKEDIDWSLASTCVSDFTLWVYPLSQTTNKESMTVSAYRVLAEIRRKVLENQRLNIRKVGIFAFIRADNSMCSRIENKLNKKMTEQKLGGKVYVEPVSNTRSLLTIPMRETMYALALADSFKRWGVI